MSFPREWFPYCNELGLEVGQRVSFVKNFREILGAFEGKRTTWPIVEGKGMITLIWLGIEEAVNVDMEIEDTHWTERVTLYPALGDLIEVIP